MGNGKNWVPLDPYELRRVLATTGIPQTGDISSNIGPLPNLREAITLLFPTTTSSPSSSPTSSPTSLPVSPVGTIGEQCVSETQGVSTPLKHWALCGTKNIYILVHHWFLKM